MFLINKNSFRDVNMSNYYNDNGDVKDDGDEIIIIFISLLLISALEAIIC